MDHADIDFFARAIRQGASKYIASMYQNNSADRIRKGRKHIPCNVFLQAVDSGQQPDFW
jgi:hypothetical protein